MSAPPNPFGDTVRITHKIAIGGLITAALIGFTSQASWAAGTPGPSASIAATGSVSTQISIATLPTALSFGTVAPGSKADTTNTFSIESNDPYEVELQQVDPTSGGIPFSEFWWAPVSAPDETSSGTNNDPWVDGNGMVPQTQILSSNTTPPVMSETGGSPYSRQVSPSPSLASQSGDSTYSGAVDVIDGTDSGESGLVGEEPATGTTPGVFNMEYQFQPSLADTAGSYSATIVYTIIGA